jgi:ribose transport system permease protein
MRRVLRGGLQFDRFSGLYLWALFILVFALWEPHTFPTMDTVHSVATQQAIEAMLALALIIPLAAGCYDLSVGATVNFSTILVVVLQVNEHWSMGTAIAVTVPCCAVIGLVNGFLVVKLGVNSFIATLGVGAVVGALQEIVSNENQPLPPQGSAWNNLAQRQLLGFPAVCWYLLILAFVVWWVLAHTPAGRYLHAIGGNPEAARLSGVAVGRWTWLSFVASASICGFAGVLYASLSGPSLDFGAGLLLPAFAAAFLGSTQLLPGRFNVWGTMIAVYVLATGVEGLQLVTSVQWLSDMFNGVALVAAVAFAVSRQKRTREVARGATMSDVPPPTDASATQLAERSDPLPTTGAEV